MVQSEYTKTQTESLVANELFVKNITKEDLDILMSEFDNSS